MNSNVVIRCTDKPATWTSQTVSLYQCWWLWRLDCVCFVPVTCVHLWQRDFYVAVSLFPRLQSLLPPGGRWGGWTIRSRVWAG